LYLFVEDQMDDLVGERETGAQSSTGRDSQLAAMQDLTEAMAAGGDTFQERVEPVLATGRKHLNFSSGYVAAAAGGIHRVLAVSTSGTGPGIGSERPLSQTYCKQTLEQSGVYLISDTTESAVNLPAQSQLAPKAYAGCPIRADGEKHGTLCFINANETVTELSDWQQTFFTHLAQWIEAEVEREMAVDTRDESQRLLEATFNSPKTFIGILEPDGTLHRANELSLEFSNSDEADVLGKPVWEGPWWNYRDALQRKCRDAVEQASEGETVSFESDHVGADGQEISTSVLIRPVTADGEVDKIILEATDITDLKRREEEMEFFNRILRHDILNGMMVISSRADLLTDELSGERAAHAETILDRTEDIVSLTEKIRSILSALSTDKLEPPQPVELAPLVDDVLDSATTATGSYTIETDIKGELVVSAGKLFEDVVKNIILNAVQHAGTSPHIKITTEVTDSKVQLRIADDGPGISDERCGAIFQEGEASPEATGTGFGLFFASVMIDSYNGDIWVEDSDLGGSAFVIELDQAD